MLKDFWEENKRFLLLGGGGVLVFLLAEHYIGNYIGGTENIRKKSQKRRQDVVLLHKGLKNGWYEEKRKGQACKDHEAGLKDKLCLPEPAALDGENSQLQIKFDKAIEDTWEGVRQEANRAGIQLPAPRPPSQKSNGINFLGGLRPAGGARRLAGPGYTYVLGFLSQP